MTDLAETPGRSEAREALATLLRLIPTMDPYEGEGSCPPCRYCYEHDWRPHRATCSWAREEAAKTRAESTLTAAIADVERLTRERDDARDETRRLWDATEADRARMAELESRLTYEDGVREAADVVADATALRDSLTAAIEAAAPKQEPMKAPRTCWTCKHYSQQVCTQPATDPSYQETERWYQSDNTDDNGEPTPSAAPCPGFTERP